MAFQSFFEQSQWKIVDVLKTEPREAELHGVDDLPLAPAARNFLARQYPRGIYRHQKEALRHAIAGEDVTLVTGTASGKSLVFQTAAVNMLARNPRGRVMAIYPMKALGTEQRDRWQRALETAGFEKPGLEVMGSPDSVVGRIDGNVPPGFRLNILERSKVVVFTPDIIHAWLFSNLNQPQVINFLREVKMIVVDEVHAYSGVFGSNAAFLFRRLQHLMDLLDARPSYICASATIAHPEAHLSSLIGKKFHMIGPEMDSSPRYPLDVYLAEPAGKERFLDEVVKLLAYLTEHTSSRFIAFVDSRKQVELISSILNRLLKENAKAAEALAAAAAAEAAALAGEPAPEDGLEAPPAKPARPVSGSRGGWGRKKATTPTPEEEEADPEGEVTGVLQQLNVLPYRAGYEDHDRRQIQERLAAGTLNGVVSTSALELGIDVPNLDICVLIGVPASATSLQQRIGRIGRHAPGSVIVVNGGDVHDQTVYADPASFFKRPLAESALYLENEHIQYIHTLCLARTNGEHDQVAKAAGMPTASFESNIDWPEEFLNLCRKESAGEPPRRFAGLKLEAHDRPNYTFPLRDVESQFKVERRDGPNVSSMGSLSFAQLMREAYPGAIYYYATIPYRVTRVNVKAKNVQVRREKRYTTQPQRTLPAIFPRLSPGGIFSAARQDGLLRLETGLLVRESIRGVIEQRGRTEMPYSYPLSRELGLFQDQPYFSRNYFTTGVVITHPALAGEGVAPEMAAAMLYEAFLLQIPYERQDIGFAADKFRSGREPFISEGAPFLAIYDQTYGSLRLSRRLLDLTVQVQAFAEAAFLTHVSGVTHEQESAAEAGEHGAAEAKATNPVATRLALVEMARAGLLHRQEGLAFGSGDVTQRDPEQWERIVMPGSKGLMVRTSEEFHVQRIFKSPNGLMYEGTPASMMGTSASVMPLLSDVVEVPGESQVGWYHVETGEMEAAGGLENVQLAPTGESAPLPGIDPGWLRRVLAAYFDEQSLVRLAERFGIAAQGEKPARVAALVAGTDGQKLLSAALDVCVEKAGMGEA